LLASMGFRPLLALATEPSESRTDNEFAWMEVRGE